MSAYPPRNPGFREFRVGQTMMKRAHMAAMLFMLIVPLVLACAAVFFMSGVFSLSSADLFAKLQAHSGRLFMDMLMAAAMTVVAAVVFLGTRASRLRLSSDGLEWSIPFWSGMGLARVSTGSVRLPWSQIQAARLEIPDRYALGARLGTSRLILRAGEKEYRLAPFIWIERTGPDHRLGFKEMFASAARTEEFLRRAPLIRLLEAHGIAIETGHGTLSVPNQYDLFAHRGLKLQLILFAIVGVYALVDGVVLRPYRVLGDLPLAGFWIVGAAAAVFILRSGEKAPAAERLAVGVLVMSAFVGAVYPAMLRINAATANPAELEYVSQASSAGGETT